MRHRQNGQNEAANLNGLVGFLREFCARHLRAMLVFSVISNLMVLAPSFHMLQIYDRVLSSGSKSTLIYITAIALFALAVYGVAETVRSKVAHRISAVFAVRYARKVFARFGELQHGDQSVGRHLRDYGMVKSFLTNRLFVSIFDLPFIPLFVTLLYFVHPTVCLLTVLGLAAMIFIGYLNVTLTESSRSAGREAEAECTGFAQQAFTRGDEIRSLGMLSELIEIWGSKSALSLTRSEDSAWKSSFYYALSRAVRQAIQVVTMAWGAWLVLGGDMSGGMIFLASMISGKALAPVEQIIGGWDNVSRSVIAHGDLDAFTGADLNLLARPNLPQPKGYLQAREVVYHYGSKVVVAGVSLDVRPGEAVIIDGGSGSGKSTLVRLLAGALEPQSGTIYLDGGPRTQWPSTQWGNAIGFCGENPGLLPGTVMANIARFSTNPDKDAVYRAAAQVGAHEMIMELPQGYQTVVSDTSSPLSISQMAQIALARAFYGQPRVILLDQPAVHFDLQTEGILLNSLAEAKKTGAAIIVATRAPLLSRIGDRRVVMKAGIAVPAELSKPAPSRFSNRPDEPEPPTATASGAST